ncbi:hypothetical protein GCM10022293_42060 [Azospirillum formosense]
MVLPPLKLLMKNWEIGVTGGYVVVGVYVPVRKNVVLTTLVVVDVAEYVPVVVTVNGSST